MRQSNVFYSGLLFALLACGPAQPRDDTGESASAQAFVPGFSVRHNEILLDGVPFTPMGFNMIGLLTPPGCGEDAGIAAHDHLDQSEMDAAKRWHANTLRFQISQPGLTGDHASIYLEEVRSGVELARTNGLAVILSMQDQSIGCGSAHPLPSAQTVAAWKALAPPFANWGHVMFELFNEPQSGETADDWAQWKNGGSKPLSNQGETAIGMQDLVGEIRGLGADNVLLADGGSYAESLQGVPLLADEGQGHGIAYAVHPYYYVPGEAEWHARYGYLTGTVPVIATEWNYKASACGTAAETIAPAFLAYLRLHGIGMTATTFDFPPLLTTGWRWSANECGTAFGGPGVLVQKWLASP